MTIYNNIYIYNVRPPFDSEVGGFITPISRTGLWYANNELVTGANLNQLSYLGGLTLYQHNESQPRGLSIHS